MIAHIELRRVQLGHAALDEIRPPTDEIIGDALTRIADEGLHQEHVLRREGLGRRCSHETM